MKRWTSILASLALVLPAFWLGGRYARHNSLSTLEAQGQIPATITSWRAHHEAEQHLLDLLETNELEAAHTFLEARGASLGASGRASLWILLAGKAVDRGARPLADAALDKFSSLASPPLWLDVARRARRSGYPTSAEILYDRLIEQYPELPQSTHALLAKASLLKQDRRRAGEAASLYRLYLERNPESRRASDAWLGLGDCLVATGESTGAIQAYRSVVEREDRSPKGVVAALSWAWCEHRAGRTPKALELLELLLEEPDLPHRDRIEKTRNRFRSLVPEERP